MSLNPEAQVRGQIRSIYLAVSRGFAGVNDDCKLIIDLDQFISNPKIFHDKLWMKLGINNPYQGPSSFNQTSQFNTRLKKMRWK